MLLLSVFDFFMPFFVVSVADVLFHLEFSLTRHLPVRGLDLAEQVYQKTLASEWTGVNAQHVPARMQSLLLPYQQLQGVAQVLRQSVLAQKVREVRK